MLSFFLNHRDPLERAKNERRMEMVRSLGMQNCEFSRPHSCDCWVQLDGKNIDGSEHTEGCLPIDVVPPPPRVDIQWTWFPSFIAQDVRMHKQLEEAMRTVWAGKLTEEMLEGPRGRELHIWICTWVSSQFPFYTGLHQWLLDLEHIQPRG